MSREVCYSIALHVATFTLAHPYLWEFNNSSIFLDGRKRWTNVNERTEDNDGQPDNWRAAGQ